MNPVVLPITIEEERQMGQDNLAPEGPTEIGMTRFYVFTASEDLKTFELVGVHPASGRDQALRKQFGKNPPLSVAVSEHAWNVRKPKWRPVPDGFENVPMPDLASSDHPDAADDPGDEDLTAAEQLAADPDPVPPVEDVEPS